MAFGKPRTPLTPEEQLQRRQNLGVGLAALSETLQGGDPVARTLGLQQQLEQQQQQAEQEAQTQRMLASMTPEQRQIYNMKKMGLPDSYIQSQFYPKQEKKGTQRYTVYDRETGTPIRSISAYDQEAINAAENNPNELIGSFAGLNEDKPSKITKSDFVVDILTKIQKDPNYKLSDSEQKILDIIERTDPTEILRRESFKRYMQTPVSVKDGQTPVSVKDGQTPVSVKDGQTPVSVKDGQTPVSVKDGQDPKYANLKDGDPFKIEGDETIYYKNQ